MSHVDIMTTLFDQDTVTRDLIASKENRARKITKLDDIKSIMSKSKMNIYEAMDLLSIPSSDQIYYIQQIEGKKES